VTEELDIEQSDALLAYLRRTGRIGTDERVITTNLAGGVSNRTVLIERPTGEAWVLKQGLAKLRVSVDWVSSPSRIHQEALGMRWLERLAPPGTITPLIFEDPDVHVLAMAAVPQPHENWKTLLLAGRLEMDPVEQFARLLATIHLNAFACREQVAVIFDDCSFFESLRIEPYYRYTATQVPPSSPFLDALIGDTRACRLTLVHGDYSPKNILVCRGKLILLDHEVIHFGDPAFDLGFSLTHLLSKAHHVQHCRAAFAAAANHYWHVYQQQVSAVSWGAALEERAIRHTLACLLARVAGRSPLEYLSRDERLHQRDSVLALLADIPRTLPDLIHQFTERLNSYAWHPKTDKPGDSR